MCNSVASSVHAVQHHLMLKPSWQMEAKCKETAASHSCNLSQDQSRIPFSIEVHGLAEDFALPVFDDNGDTQQVNSVFALITAHYLGMHIAVPLQVYTVSSKGCLVG